MDLVVTDPRRGFVWKTANGRQLKLHEITDKHLGNILRLLDRKAIQEDGSYDYSIFGNNFKILNEEAHKRGFIWRVFPGKLYTPCTFVVGDTKCSADSVMYTCKDEVGTTKIADQEARCAKHRPDALSYYKKTCYGCLKEVELVVELAEQLYCEACIAEPQGILWEYLAVFMVLFTWLLRPLSGGKTPATIERKEDHGGPSKKTKKIGRKK